MLQNAFFTVIFCQKDLFLCQIVKVWDEKMSWKDANKCQIGSGHNFFIFSLSEKFFSNLEIAEQFKIIDIKRFDEIWRSESLRLLQSSFLCCKCFTFWNKSSDTIKAKKDISLKFQKAQTKIGAFLGLPSLLSQFS